MSSPLINKINLELDLDVPEKEAKAVSNMIYKKHILTALDKALKAYENSDIFINKTLEIDLGCIKEKDISYELENALRQKLSLYAKEDIYAISSKQRNNNLSSVYIFFNYLQNPVIPWEIEKIEDFEPDTIAPKAVSKILNSRKYLQSLIQLISDKIEIYHRFFELCAPLNKFPLLIKNILATIPLENKEAYIEILNRFIENKPLNKQIFKEIFYYLMLHIFFGKKEDRKTSLFISTLVLHNPAFIKESDIRAIFEIGSNIYPIDKMAEGEELVGKEQSILDKSPVSEDLFSKEEQSDKATDEIEKSKQGKQSILDKSPVSEDLFSKEERGDKATDEIDKSGTPNIQFEIEKNYLIKQIQELYHKYLQNKNIPSDNLFKMEEQLKIIIKNIKESQSNHREIKFLEKTTNTDNIKELLNIAIQTQADITEHIPVYNAGIILFYPFLISFFDKLNLLEDRKQFKSVKEQIKAVHLLHYLSGFHKDAFEHLMLLNKLICGVNILFPVGKNYPISEPEKKEINLLLKAVIQNWAIIKNTSIEGLQESFIKRKGILEQNQNDWILRVETKGIDILLENLPWNIRLISFPWNDFIIYVDWEI